MFTLISYKLMLQFKWHIDIDQLILKTLLILIKKRTIEIKCLFITCKMKIVILLF